MPKLTNETDLKYRRRVIDIKSESFCAAKWYNATIWLGSGQTTSCHHPLPHQVSVEEVKANPKALHNTPQKKLERSMMQEGARPKGCEYCWKIEDMDKDAISDRVYKTLIYKDKDIDIAFNTPRNEDINLKTLEIAFDRTCNFACSYCNPAFSTTWVKDIKQKGAYKNLTSDGRNHFTHPHKSSQLYDFNEENPYVTAFFKWWDSDLHETLDELRITGGEPLMSGHTWKLLDWFKKNKKQSTTRLAINSNLGFDKERIDKLLSATNDVKIDLYTSNESMNEHAEYIRDGLQWDQWYNNVMYLIKSKKLRGLHVMCTINALCLSSLPTFLEMLVGIKMSYGADAINFTLNILRFPSFQSALVLPKKIKLKYKTQLEEFLLMYGDQPELHQMEVNQIKRLIDYLDIVKTPHSEAFEMPKLLNDFKEFYKQYDERRNKDFVKTFPELKEWYGRL
jgi:organic radical activating enzyme